MKGNHKAVVDSLSFIIPSPTSDGPNEEPDAVSSHGVFPRARGEITDLEERLSMSSSEFAKEIENVQIQITNVGQELEKGQQELEKGQQELRKDLESLSQKMDRMEALLLSFIQSVPKHNEK